MKRRNSSAAAFTLRGSVMSVGNDLGWGSGAEGKREELVAFLLCS